MPDMAADQVQPFIAACAAKGVELKWFGADEPHGYTSNHRSWRYAGAQEAPNTDRILSRLFDMRIPLTFSIEDCKQIAAIISAVATRFQ